MRRDYLKIFSIASILIPFTILAFFLISIVIDGIRYLSIDFIIGLPSGDPDETGILPAIIGSIYVTGLATIISFLMGVGISLYITEFVSSKAVKDTIYFIVDMLAGVPSVIYGIVGLSVVGVYLNAGRSVLTGAVTLAFLILPLVTVSSIEAIRSIPDSLRLSMYSLGASRLEVVKYIVIPLALPRALTGAVLAIARAIGEAAPILIISGVLFTRSIPISLLDEFTVLPLVIFNWVTRPQEIYLYLASSAIIVLLTIYAGISSLAIYMRSARTRRVVEI